MAEYFMIGAGLLLAGILIGAVLDRLFAITGSLDQRLTTLEQCAAIRLPHRTAAGVEDALAVNLDLVRQANEMELELAAIRARAAQQAEILRLVREGPAAYDPERPAGRRP